MVKVLVVEVLVVVPGIPLAILLDCIGSYLVPLDSIEFHWILQFAELRDCFSSGRAYVASRLAISPEAGRSLCVLFFSSEFPRPIIICNFCESFSLSFRVLRESRRKVFGILSGQRKAANFLVWNCGHSSVLFLNIGGYIWWSTFVGIQSMEYSRWNTIGRIHSANTLSEYSR